MPRKVKAVDLLVEQIVPKDLQGMLNTYSAKEMNNFLLVLSQKYPDKYVDISHRLAKAGLDVTYYQGDSMGLEDTEQVLDRDHLLKQMDGEIDDLQKEYRNDPEEFRKRRENVWLKYNDLILKKTTQEANRKGNAMGMSVMSGARGKPQQVQAMLSTPGLYQDANGKIIPIFVRNSFAEGLRPLELMAGTFGARSAVVSTKVATAKGGDIGKLMAQATGKLLVTEKDCGVRNGLKYDLDAEALPGKVLATDTGSLKRGTILDRHALGILQKEGFKKVVARSPITCKADGLCAKCVGKMLDSNDLPQVGDHVGITAANALSEPLTQGALCLHEDTKVKMGDGKPKPIKDIKVGDKVMGADKNGKAIEVTVLEVFENAKKYCYTFTIGDKKVTCSLQHEFPDEKGVKKAIGKFRKGENILTAEGVIPLMKKDDYGMARTFDLHVDHEDHLFVLDNSLIVSNSAKHCLSLEDTEVLMCNGEIHKLNEISPGDTIVGVSDDLKTLVPRTVLNVVKQGDQPVFRYKFKAPRHRYITAELVSTDCHKVLTDKGLVPVGETDHILLPRESKFKGSHDPMAFLMGFYMGDGIRWRNKTKGADIRISCAEPSTASEVDAYLGELGLKFAKRKRSSDWAVVENSYVAFERDHKGRVTAGVRNRLKKKVHEFGWEGKYAHEKTIPSQVWSWNEKSVGEFVGGFLTADGSLANLNEGKSMLVTACSTSKRMLEDLIRLMWSRLGVRTSNLSVCRATAANYRNHDLWSFSISQPSEIKRLLLKVRLMGPKKDKQADYLRRLAETEPAYETVRFDLVEAISEGIKPCFDLTIDSPNELFVLANGLVVKNTAGQAKGKAAYGGLDIVTQFVQSPEEYQHRATVASVAGKVEQINPAPQGGVFIRVGGQDHYAPQGYDPMVKVGDDVDEGDQLSDGLMDVRDVVRYKGLGAGRKYYVDRLQQIYKDSGLNAHPKNLEIVARGALNTVTLDDFMDGMDALPDDAVEYNKVTRVWEPENEIQTSPDDTARNTYLSRDILHYTAGTKLGRAQLKDIRDAGITQIHTVKDKPPFTSNMDRLRVASHYNDDWLASMSSSYLKKQLGEGAIRGADTNVNENQHWAPRLAYGKGFGEKIRETGKF